MSIIGIDLGTTNSLVSVWKENNSILIPNSLNEYLTPSVVGIDDNGKILVGKVAEERLITHPQYTVANFKRYMGTGRNFKLKDNTYRLEELSSFIIRALKEDAESYLNETITEAVISVPAYFNNAQRNATKIAGQLAGLKIERLINEPTAAAISYGLQEKENESTYLVFDLGGGTFDVSILELFDGVMEVRASAGDNYLGGEDFLEVIIKYFLEKNKLKLNNLTPQELNRLRTEAEKCKKELSKVEVSDITTTIDNKKITTEITRDLFEKLSEPLIHRIRTPIERALRDASIKIDTLDNILLVGGATKMPLIRSIVSKIFGRLPFCHINPDEVVGIGAGIQAALKSMNSALDDVVLTDVCPYTLGIEVRDKVGEDIISGRFLPIIERNTVIPASRVKSLTTSQPMQNQINVVVYQGESMSVKNNIEIGTFKIPIKPKKELQDIDIRFTYDINGLLEVEVLLLETGEKRQMIFNNNISNLTQEEIEERIKFLSTLKMHPRDQSENRLILARAERLYEELLGEDRDAIRQTLNHFEVIIETQDTDKIKIAAKEINNFLNNLEESYT